MFRTPSQSLRIWSHLNKLHGPLVRLDIPGRERTVLVFDPWVAEQVYRQEGRHPTRPAFHSLRAAKLKDGEPVGLQGMLTSNGEPWKTARKCAQVCGFPINARHVGFTEYIAGATSTAKPG